MKPTGFINGLDMGYDRVTKFFVLSTCKNEFSYTVIWGRLRKEQIVEGGQGCREEIWNSIFFHVDLSYILDIKQ